MSRGDLSEAEWRFLKDLLPAERGRKNRPAFDNRAIVNGILWRIRTGTPWRDVPEKYGKWMTVSQRSRRWSEAGVWEAVASTLVQTMADNSRHSIDSTTVRGHVSAASAKGGLASRLLAARGSGLPVKFIVSVMPEAPRSPSISPATKRRTARHSKAVTELVEVRPDYLLADKGYDTDAIRAKLKAEGIRHVIPSKVNRKTTIQWNRRIYREHNRIGRAIGHLRVNRAIARGTISSLDPSSTPFISLPSESPRDWPLCKQRPRDASYELSIGCPIGPCRGC